MSNKRPNAGAELTKTVEVGQVIAEQVSMAEAAAQETIPYTAPLPPIPRMTTVDVPRLDYRRFDDAYFAQRQAEDAAAAQQAAQIGVWRAQTAANLAAGGYGETMIPFARGNRMFVRDRPLRPAIASDPLVVNLQQTFAAASGKIDELKVDMTDKQKLRIDRRMRAISFVRKGKREGERKVPTSAQLQKVIYLAYEMHASRRRAQLGAQMRRARAERHSLVQKKRTVAMPDGSVINYNQRAAKKEYSNAVKKDQQWVRDQQAKRIRQEQSAQNKAIRAQIKANRPKNRALAQAAIAGPGQ
jgi:hypothetical protein